MPIVLDALHELRERARVMLERGDVDGAANALVSAAQQTHVAEQDYVSILGPLVDVLLRRDDVRSALTVQWYLALSDGGRSESALPLLARPGVTGADRARTLAAAGDLAGAAQAMEDDGLVAAAAIYREKAGDFQRARALWSRLAGVVRASTDAYPAALVQFNLARCALQCRDERHAREASVAAVGLLEEAADHFESVGQRERAFDCFHVLVQIGRETRMFEDVVEGFVNCIRILREDHLKYFALQYFEEALEAARTHGELSAAATLAREAADYARSLGMDDTAVHYVLRGAELWREVSKEHLARGAKAEIAENAHLAAILAFGEIGHYASVGALYRELAEMDLDEGRRKHYARASRRYDKVRNEAVEGAPLPSHLRQNDGFPDVWHVDLLEWEQRGSAAEACADVLLDRRWPDLIRRKAMLARLTAFAVEQRPDDAGQATTHARVRLAEQLAQLQLYAVLSPLEHLFEREEAPVRVAVLGAMQQLFFKRSFVTIRQGLRDRDAQVAEQAAKAVEALHFQHAFDPLSRIVRESGDARARTAAIRAISNIDSMEAAEFLLGMLEHGTQADRAAAFEGLRRVRASRLAELARAVLPTAPPELGAALRSLLHQRGLGG